LHEISAVFSVSPVKSSTHFSKIYWNLQS